MKPNILVLILDALRAGSMSCYGYEKRTTPALDDFAADNILFSHCYTNATWTIPTHASMLSGLYLSQHRIESTKQNRRFHQEIVPLPVALNRSGYRTAAFSHNPLFGPAHHFDYFDEFYDLDNWFSEGSVVQKMRQWRKWPQPLDTTIRYLEKMQRPRHFFEALLEWTGSQDEPFFVMANQINIHYPWAPPPDLLWGEMGFGVRALLADEMNTLKPWQFNPGWKQVTKQHRDVWRQLYDASIRHIDREWKRFIKKLQAQKGWENLILIVTADHGELLGEHQGIVGHMLSLHDRIIHVPLIIRHPDYEGSRLVESVVQTVDLYSSVMKWTDTEREVIPGAQLRCPSWSEALNRPHERFAFAEEDYTDSYNLIAALQSSNPAFDTAIYPERRVAVHDGTHKLIWNNRGTPEFYHVAADRGEVKNLVNQTTMAPLLAKMEKALEEWERDKVMFPPEEVTGSEQEPEMVERLRALGYVA